ncbi:MAG: RnfH family protein [Betaproteobacteria bacterium]|nr:RnfH family protein [Betaproteobacteria bacterium]
MSANNTLIRIEICVAWPERVLRQTLSVAMGTTPSQLRAHPELQEALRAAWSEASAVGVFGTAKSMRQPLQDGDRLELWRPLRADPKEARRALARLKNADAGAPRRRRDRGSG